MSSTYQIGAQNTLGYVEMEHGSKSSWRAQEVADLRTGGMER
jgi:hypothetical protein